MVVVVEVMTVVVVGITAVRDGCRRLVRQCRWQGGEGGGGSSTQGTCHIHTFPSRNSGLTLACLTSP